MFSCSILCIEFPSGFSYVLIGLTQQWRKLEFARRAGGQVVRKICVVVSALRRSVSFRGAVAGCRLPGHCEPEFPVIAIKQLTTFVAIFLEFPNHRRHTP